MDSTFDGQSRASAKTTAIPLSSLPTSSASSASPLSLSLGCSPKSSRDRTTTTTIPIRGGEHNDVRVDTGDAGIDPRTIQQAPTRRRISQHPPKKPALTTLSSSGSSSADAASSSNPDVGDGPFSPVSPSITTTTASTSPPTSLSHVDYASPSSLSHWSVDGHGPPERDHRDRGGEDVNNDSLMNPSRRWTAGERSVVTPTPMTGSTATGHADGVDVDSSEEQLSDETDRGKVEPGAGTASRSKSSREGLPDGIASSAAASKQALSSPRPAPAGARSLQQMGPYSPPASASASLPASKPRQSTIDAWLHHDRLLGPVSGIPKSPGTAKSAVFATPSSVQQQYHQPHLQSPSTSGIPASVDMDRRASASSAASSGSARSLSQATRGQQQPTRLSTNSLADLPVYVPGLGLVRSSGSAAPLRPQVEPFSPSSYNPSLAPGGPSALLQQDGARRVVEEKTLTQEDLAFRRTATGPASGTFQTDGSSASQQPWPHVPSSSSSYRQAHWPPDEHGAASGATARHRTWSDAPALAMDFGASSTPSANGRDGREGGYSRAPQRDSLSLQQHPQSLVGQQGYDGQRADQTVSTSGPRERLSRQYGGLAMEPPLAALDSGLQSHGPYSRDISHFPGAPHEAYRHQSLDGLDSINARYVLGGGLVASGASSSSEASAAAGEEITTIFVVGFPEDMQEREFQNMFLFARGFEAATLKIPASTAAARERDAAAAAAVSAIAASLPNYNSRPDSAAPSVLGFSTPSSAGPLPHDYSHQPYDEDARHYSVPPSNDIGLHSTSVSGARHGQASEGTQRISHALTAAAVTASASTANLAGQANRKQIIGFAKFRTRDDALQARDALSGRKIDAGDKSCILKAEMAKKNLHTKKSATEPVLLDGGPLAPTSGSDLRSSLTALDKLAEREMLRSRESSMSMGSSSYHTMGQYPSSTIERDIGKGAGASAAYPSYPPHRRDAHGDGEVSYQGERDSRARSQADAAYEAFYSASNHQAFPSTFSDPLDRQHQHHYQHKHQHPQQTNFDSDASLRNTFEAAAPVAAPFLQGAAQRERSTSTPGKSLLPATLRSRSYTGTVGFGKAILQTLDESDDVDLPPFHTSSGFAASAYNSRGEGDESGAHASRRQPPPALSSLAQSSAHEAGLHVRSYGDQAYINEEYHKLAPGGVSTRSPPSVMHASTSPHSYDHASLTSFNSAAPSSRSMYPSPPSEMASPTYANFSISRIHNRADDNMPISTLYVGGLPTVLPNVPAPASAGYLEDALRAVFQRSPGFKRLSYRQKSQGPMCFVEFEDVAYATKALGELYGHTLGGLVKGGIRLAYSKNPLGVRMPAGPGSPTAVSPSYFASDALYGTLDPPAGSMATPTMPTRMSQGGPLSGTHQYSTSLSSMHRMSQLNDNMGGTPGYPHPSYASRD